MESAISYLRIWCLPLPHLFMSVFPTPSPSSAFLVQLQVFLLHFLFAILHTRWESSPVFHSILLFCQASLLFLLASSPARPLGFFLFLSAPTPGSKVSCLTVNVLSFPQREAARWQRENYSVLHSINLHRVTRSHTYLQLAACVLSCEFVPGGTYCLSISVCLCVRVWGHRASQQF